MCQHLPSRQASCYYHTLSDELVADQVNDQVNEKKNIVHLIQSRLLTHYRIVKVVLYGTPF